MREALALAGAAVADEEADRTQRVAQSLAAMDRVKEFSVAGRLTREELHARRSFLRQQRPALCRIQCRETGGGAARPGASRSRLFRAGAQEFYVNATRKRALRLSEAEALQVLSALRDFPILPMTEELVFAAIEVKNRCQISSWDAAIVAAAEALGARELFSEDLNDGQVYGSVRVVNPFK